MHRIKRFESFSSEEDYFQPDELESDFISGKETETEFVFPQGGDLGDEDSIDERPFLESSQEYVQGSNEEKKFIQALKKAKAQKGQNSSQDKKTSQSSQKEKDEPSQQVKESSGAKVSRNDKKSQLMKKLYSKVREARRRKLLLEKPQD